MKNNFNYHRQTVAALSGSRWTKSLVGCLTGLLLLASFSSANAAPQAHDKDSFPIQPKGIDEVWDAIPSECQGSP